MSTTTPTRREEEALKSYWYPDRTADLSEVNTGYRKWDSDKRILYLMFISFMIAAVSFLMTIEGREITDMYNLVKQQVGNEADLLRVFGILIGGLTVLVFLVTVYFLRRATPVYLIDFATYTAEEKYKIPHKSFMEKSKDAGKPQICFSKCS
jgi:3-ketoacyl-CoA synthase